MQRRRTLFDTPRCSLSRLEPRTTENNNSNVERTTTSAQQQTSDLPPAYDSVLYCEVETQEERSRLLIAFRRFDNENIQRQAHEYMYSPSHFIIKEGVEEVRVRF
ncbi:unnamed protein product [Adineta steineri]|uniref:Uncharacterized protein n=1 Tax=Adineta steineri TaxID=433720 RepID=A0A814M9Y6_9BILA|nr:unnamed protein product [Adineta steineri]